MDKAKKANEVQWYRVVDSKASDPMSITDVAKWYHNSTDANKNQTLVYSPEEFVQHPGEAPSKMSGWTPLESVAPLMKYIEQSGAQLNQAQSTALPSLQPVEESLNTVVAQKMAPDVVSFKQRIQMFSGLKGKATSTPAAPGSKGAG